MALTQVPAEWIITAADRRAVALGYRWDQDAVDHAVQFFARFLEIRNDKYKGPFKLEDWQAKATARIFGWRRPDGRRRFTEVYINICKKNGKSFYLAGLALYGLKMTPSAEVYTGALNREQAGVIFNQVDQFIKISPKLKGRFRVSKYNHTVAYDHNGARLKSLSADAASADGVSSSLTILDEIHRWGGNDELYKVMRGAGQARSEPLIVHLTTAGDDSSTFAREIHSRAQAILDGDDSDLTFLGIIYALGPNDDHSLEENWYRANPSLGGPGSIIEIDRFREEYHKFRRLPARFANWCRLHLGIWERSVNPWLSDGLWESAGDEELRDLSWWAGRDVAVGIDLASTKDLTALTMTTLDGGDLVWHSDYFLPEETVVERSENDGVPYKRWAEDDQFAQQTPGNATDVRHICDYLVKLRDELGINIYAVGMDPFGTLSLGPMLFDEGFEPEYIRQIAKNYNPAAVEVERRLLNGTLRHDASPITQWCINNTKMVSDSYGQVRPSKKGAEKLRIDGTSAGLMSVGMLLKKPAPAKPRIYRI